MRETDATPGWETGSRAFFDALGGGIVVVFALEPFASPPDADAGRRGGPGGSLPHEIGSWLHIDETGGVTGYTGKVEVGQNIRTSLTEIIADELTISPDGIRLVMGDTDLSPFDFGTVGSRTTPVVAPQMRIIAAAAREILRERAGGNRVPRTIAEIAEITGGQRIFRAVGDEIVTKPPWSWPAFPRPNGARGRSLVTGEHRYTSDLTHPEMHWGAVLRAPSAGATLLSLDTTAVSAIRGAAVVRDGDFVGVVAPDAPTAALALGALGAEWRAAEEQPSSDTIFDYFQSHRTPPPTDGGASAFVQGSVADGLAEADHVLDAVYTVAYIAHAPLETRAALAAWSDDGDRLTVWTGTQRPFAVRAEIALALGIAEARVRVIVPDTGSGYGGKHTGDAAVEAARLSRAASKPVKLVWSRDEEFAHAYFRPAGLLTIRSGVRADGTLTAWEHHNTNSGSSALQTLYAAPHQHLEFHAVPSPLRQGSYRALAATANHFARESHMDELAHAVGICPLAFRLRNLGDSEDQSRLRAVLCAAAERFGWGASAPPHRGFGIAGGHEKGSYVATCAEVFVDPETRKLTVIRAVTAFECGAVGHEDNVRNQVEGAVIQGIGGALWERIVFADGRIENGRFSEYRVPRFPDIPHLETVLLDRPDLPSVGAGETPIIAIAPALANALFAARGVRLRSLPLAPDGTVPG